MTKPPAPKTESPAPVLSSAKRSRQGGSPAQSRVHPSPSKSLSDVAELNQRLAAIERDLALLIQRQSPAHTPGVNLKSPPPADTVAPRLNAVDESAPFQDDALTAKLAARQHRGMISVLAELFRVIHEGLPAPQQQAIRGQLWSVDRAFRNYRGSVYAHDYAAGAALYRAMWIYFDQLDREQKS